MRTLIFDMDGTLYQDERVHDINARQIANRLGPEERAGFREDWEKARAGAGVIRIGMGYDGERDLLFRHADGQITHYVDWDGHEEPALPPGHAHEGDEPVPPTETEAFGPGRFNIGDPWGIGGALGVHHGIRREGLREAFMATREIQDDPAFDLRVDRALVEAIRRLTHRSLELVVMSNSPGPAVEATLGKLGLAGCFGVIVPEAHKPQGLADFLNGRGAGPDTLSIGDNFFNDIAPALRYGGQGLYIDHYRSGLGRGAPRCHIVDSLEEMRSWLEERLPAC